MIKGFLLIFLFVFIFSFTTGIFVHEGTHVFQAKLDDRVEPVGIKAYPDCNGGIVCITSKWTTDDVIKQIEWSNEFTEREVLPTQLQFIFSSITAGVTTFVFLNYLQSKPSKRGVAS